MKTMRLPCLVLALGIFGLGVLGCSRGGGEGGVVDWPQLVALDEAAGEAGEAADGGEAGSLREKVTAVVVEAEQLLSAGLPDGVDDAEGCAALLDDLRGLATRAREQLGEEGAGEGMRDLAKAFGPVTGQLLEVSGVAAGQCPTCGGHHGSGHEHGAVE